MVQFCTSLFVDHLRYPPSRFADPVVDSGLLLDGTAEPGRGDAYQGPPAVKVDDKGAARVAQTGVHFATPVSGAKHLLVKLNSDGFLLVPRLALSVVNYRHVNLPNK